MAKERYRVRAHGQIIINQEIEITVFADSIDEAHNIAADAFDYEMNEKHPWWDYATEITTEII